MEILTEILTLIFWHWVFDIEIRRGSIRVNFIMDTLSWGLYHGDAWPTLTPWGTLSPILCHVDFIMMVVSWDYHGVFVTIMDKDNLTLELQKIQLIIQVLWYMNYDMDGHVHNAGRIIYKTHRYADKRSHIYKDIDIDTHRYGDENLKTGAT